MRTDEDQVEPWRKIGNDPQRQNRSAPWVPGRTQSVYRLKNLAAVVISSPTKPSRLTAP
jgi:hypothetical protein